MKKLIFILAILIYFGWFIGSVNAGLPPTSSKISGDSANVTTFNYQFPNLTGTHTGVTLSIPTWPVPNPSPSGSWLVGTGSIWEPSTSFSGSLNAGTNQIINVVDPTAAQMAATKNYVDTQLAQLNPAAAVFAASTANIVGTYTNAVSGVCIGDIFAVTATSTFTTDGQTPAVGNRILFKNQTSSFQDGVWVLTTLANVGVTGAVFTRATDSDSSLDFNSGQIVPVTNGTTLAGSSWYQTANNTTCNSSAQTWTLFQSPSSAYLQVANNLSDVASKSTAFNNVSPMTTAGDIIYGGTSGAGARFPIGAAGQYLMVAPSPTPTPTALQWTTVSPGQVGDSSVVVTGGNGYGSSSTGVRRWSTIQHSAGSDITYSDSATLGGKFVINTSGTYAMHINDVCVSGVQMSPYISLNASTFTVGLNSPIGLQSINSSTTNSPTVTGLTYYLPATSVIRVQESSNAVGQTTVFAGFSITRVN